MRRAPQPGLHCPLVALSKVLLLREATLPRALNALCCRWTLVAATRYAAMMRVLRVMDGDG
eukprot:5415282-Alexandrium_andersonii.AAC.1